MMYNRLFLLALLIYLASAATFFITPQKSCGLDCTGDVTKPFDNLLIALNSAQSKPSVTLLLLNDTTSPHYVLQKEYDASNTAFIYDFPDNLTITMSSSLIIKPLYCNEAPAMGDPSLSGKCVKEGRKLTLYVKTTAFTLRILQNAQFQGITFNAIEDIKTWNSGSNNDVKDCLYNRKQCCEENNPASIQYPSTVKCQGDSIMNMIYNSALFDMKSPGFASLMFQNTDFINFQNPNLGSLIQTGARRFNLIFNESLLNQIYFNRGLISHTQDSIDKNASSILFEGVRFTNYNPWDLKKSTGSEGYLISSLYRFSGTLKVSKSSFINVTTAVRASCWSQTSDYYKKPMNNFLWSDQRSRSDLWMQYESDHLRTELMSSLILIREMEGVLSVNNSVFQNLIGTSGSVIRIDDVTNSTTGENRFKIENSVFEGNFAYDGFANVRITKKSSSFYSLLDCPYIEVTNSSFLSSAGCPGSYGNVLFLCYWNSQPSNTLKNYSLNYVSQDMIFEKNSGRVKIIDSKFMKNRLAISNSLAIIGSDSIVFKGNTFQDNGATTGKLAVQALEGSYALERYSKTLLSEIDGFYNFGQSTAVYVDHFFSFASLKNTFARNWGSWEGSLSLASSLTMKNWISSISESINFEGDSFIEHTGIPAKVASASLKYTGLQESAYMEPIITLSIDQTGSDKIGTYENVVNIKMKGIVFGDNQLSFDYNSYTYNSYELGEFKNRELSTKTRYQTGLVKLLVEFEAADLIYKGFQYDSPANSVSISLIDSVINNNVLKTDGCLLMTSWAEYFIMENIKISNNKINQQIYADSSKDLELSPSLLMSNSALNNVRMAKQGLICSCAGDAILNPPKIQVQMNNIQAFENEGVLIDLFSNSQTNLYLTNSKFERNRGTQVSVLLAFEKSNMTLINNTFLRNNNTLGIICIMGETNFTGISNTYVKNTGKYASLFLVLNSNEGKIVEIGARVSLNDLQPSLKKSSTQVSPLSGLYFINSGSFVFYESEFRQNSPYSGLITAAASDIYFYNCEIVENMVEGLSVLGNFASVSNLYLTNVKLTGNTLKKDPEVPLNNLALIRISTGSLNMDNVDIHGSAVGKPFDGILIFGNTIGTEMNNVAIREFIVQKEGQAMIDLSFSAVKVNNLNCSGTTGIFNLIKTTLSARNIRVESMINTFSSGYIANLYVSTLNIKGLFYRANDFSLSSGSSTALFIGDTSNLNLVETQLINLHAGLENLMDFQGKGVMFITDSRFLYDTSSLSLTLFYFDGLESIVVQNCIFKGVERIMSATDTSKGVYFLKNTIFTGSQLQNLVITQTSSIIIAGNDFMKIPVTDGMKILKPYSTREDYLDLGTDSLYGAQIEILEIAEKAVIRDNRFVSLYGLNGIISVATQINYYMVNFTDNIFVNNTGSNGGAIYLSGCNYVSSSYGDGGSGPDYSNNGDTVTFRASDQDKNGGIFSTDPPVAWILNSVFVQNTAILYQGSGGYGGVLYQTSPDMTAQNTIIDENSIFVNNSAETMGGAIYFDYNVPDVDSSCLFIKNVAQVPNHIASYPVQIVLLEDGVSPDVAFIPGNGIPYFDSTKDFYVWKGISSGLVTEKTYVFAVLDIFGQPMYNDYTSTLKMYSFGIHQKARSEFTEKFQLIASAGEYNLSEFEFKYKTNSVINVTFVASALQGVVPPACEDYSYVTSITVELHFRDCGLGEYTDTEDNGIVSCEECRMGFWQVDPEEGSATYCEECDGTGMICLGGNNVGPKPGFWRLNETADIVLKCPRTKSCLGNVITSSTDTSSVVLNKTGICAEGYTGHLCHTCIEGWGKSGGADSECVNCKGTALAYIQLILVLGFQVMVFILGIRESMALSVKYSNDDQIGTYNPVLLRIIINYLQLVSLLSSISVAWPDSMQNLLSMNSKFSLISDQMFSVDCLFALGEDAVSVRTVFLKALIIAVSPFVFIMLAVLFWVIYFKIRRIAILKNKEFGNKVITTIVVILFNMQPSVIKTSFGLFQCSNIYRYDTSLNYLALDYDVKCWEGDHKFWTLGLAVPSLVLWIVILPSILIYLLRSNQKILHTAKVARKYSFIYNGYSNNKFYWEFIIMIRKIVLICVIIFAGMHSTNLQLYMSLIAILVAYMLHSINNPYSNKNLNDIEKASLFSLGIVILCALYYQIASAGATLDYIVLICGVLGNLYFFIYFLRFFIALQLTKIKSNQKAMKILGYVNHRFCGCLRQPHIQLVLGKVRSLFSLESDISLTSASVDKSLKKKKSLRPEDKEQKLFIGEIGKAISFKDSVSHDISVSISPISNTPKRNKDSEKRFLNVDTPNILSPEESVANSMVYDHPEERNDSIRVPDEVEKTVGGGGDCLGVSIGDDLNLRSIEKMRNRSRIVSSSGDKSERRRLKSESLVSSRSFQNGIGVTIAEYLPNEGRDVELTERITFEGETEKDNNNNNRMLDCDLTEIEFQDHDKKEKN